jgi:GMP synthase (glutamine-hydrolysing)
MKVTVLQHVPDEPLGQFEAIFAEREITFEYLPLYETNEVSAVDASHIIILGGPMSVNDEKEYPFLKEEKNLVRACAKTGRPVLGLCLGAQLIASAYGACVRKYIPELGWSEVRHLGIEPFSDFPEGFSVFQWHEETFEIPQGGVLLCTGDRVTNQAFSMHNALGLQFHLEMNRELVDLWTRNALPAERERILQDTAANLQQSNVFCRMIADHFIGMSAGMR